MDLTRYALYLHDYGSQIGLRLAMKARSRVAALVIQNGDIYEDQLGPKYEPLKDYWANPTPEGREKLPEAVSEEGFRDEFLSDVREELADADQSRSLEAVVAAHAPARWGALGTGNQPRGDRDAGAGLPRTSARVGCGSPATKPSLVPGPRRANAPRRPRAPCSRWP